MLKYTPTRARVLAPQELCTVIFPLVRVAGLAGTYPQYPPQLAAAAVAEVLAVEAEAAGAVKARLAATVAARVRANPMRRGVVMETSGMQQ
ncbi:hypothetical protein GCM10014719_47810 [Planomonospora parontospora subsp. antibiotica]|nr:hypothetical protein GCM10014719_47810 [Planomonospora parontospora subsp. antibiotica]GII17910.1 hypothetical protein Ppa05_46360 [Planomonospora parontospora subsp. antibiotica]